MTEWVGILYSSGDFPILYFVILAINVCFLFCMFKSQTIMPKSLTCGYSISVPDTLVVGYHTAPTHY